MVSIEFAVITAALGVLTVWALTGIGTSFGLPGPLAFVIVLAAIYGTLKVFFRI